MTSFMLQVRDVHEPPESLALNRYTFIEGETGDLVVAAVINPEPDATYSFFIDRPPGVTSSPFGEKGHLWSILGVRANLRT